jgi:hypothetical protein
MTRLRATATAIALAMAAGPPANAQTATDLLERGVASYSDLQYDPAAILLRRALDVRGPGALPDTLLPEANAYLGAVEHFRGRRRAAAVAFHAALAADVRFRPDTLVFPPAVTAAFDEARRETAFIRISVPADTTIQVGEDVYVVRVDASALHNVTVMLTDAARSTIQTLHTGPIVDSLEVRWDGTGRDAARLPDAVELRVVSQLRGGGRRVVRQLLHVRVRPADTLPFPPPLSQAELRPEREPANPAVGPLVAGLVTGVGAAVLPTLVTDERDGATLRFAVGGALGLAGVVGFLSGSRDRAIPENVRANTMARDAWWREREAVRAENARRRAVQRLRITAGEQVVEPDR